MASDRTHGSARSAAPRRIVAGTRMLFAASLAAWLVAAAVAHAQQYHAEDVDEKARALRPIAQGCVKDPARYAADRDRFREFFEKYYFPAMTQFSPKGLEALGSLRYELFNNYLWPATSPELQADLTRMAYANLQPIPFSKTKNYHPAVRYNAILVLGLLDEQYPIDTGSRRRPSKPYKEANEYLTKLVAYAADGNPVDPSLLVGALIGLERHAQNRESLERAQVEAMTAALLKLAALEPLAPQADRPIANWIRQQTATILAKLGSPGPKGEVHATLLKMIAGETEPKLTLDSRCQIGALLRLIDYQGATIDGKATADAVLKLVDDVVADELKTARDFEEAHLGPGLGGFGGRRNRARVRVSQFGDEIQYERRVLLARLTDLRSALDATRPLVPAETQSVYDAVLAAMRPVADGAANPDEIGLELARKVREMANAIQRATNPGAAPAAEEPADLF